MNASPESRKEMKARESAIRNVKAKYSQIIHDREIIGFPEVVEIDEKGLEKLLKKEDTVIVDFYGTPCGPCRAFTPIFCEVAKEYGEDACFATLNAYNADGLWDDLKLRGVPTVVIYKDGKEKHRLVGSQQKLVLENAIRNYLD